MQAKKKGIRTAVFGSSKLEIRQSTAGGGSRASPGGGDIFPPRGWERSIDDEDDENCAGIRVSVSVEKEADKLSNDKDGSDSDIRSIVKFWGCMTGRFMPRSGGMTDSEPVLTSYKILTPVFRGWAAPAELSGGAAITPEVLQLAMSKITGDVADVLKTFSDFSFRIAD